MKLIEVQIVRHGRNFATNSVGFFNELEDINPGVLGNDDAVYGLPENLAREIQEECFFPEGLLCELRRYQEWGVKYALHQERILLGDEMGWEKQFKQLQQWCLLEIPEELILLLFAQLVLLQIGVVK